MTYGKITSYSMNEKVFLICVFDANDLEYMKKKWNDFINNITWHKCSSLMNFSRALDLVTVLEFTKKPPERLGNNLETGLKCTLELLCLLKLWKKYFCNQQAYSKSCHPIHSCDY